MTKQQKSFVIEDKKVMKEWDYKENKKIGLDPSKATTGSKKRAHWICRKHKKSYPDGYKWEAVIFSRCKKRTGCPNCARLKNGSLLETNPDLMEEWDYEKNNKLGIYPEEIAPTSKHIEAHWICIQNPEHKWSAKIYNRSRKERPTGCPICNKGSDHITQENSIFKKRPDLLSFWDFRMNEVCRVYPNEVSERSSKEAYWRCNCGHRWKRSLNDIRSNDIHCPKCTKLHIKKVSYGKFNEVKSNIKWSKKNKIDPYNIPKLSKKKALFKCSNCSYEWEDMITYITKGKKCPNCSTNVSKGELRIESYLKKLNLKYKKEAYFKDCYHKNVLRFDFKVMIDNREILIEYDGEQHYYPLPIYNGVKGYLKTKYRDELKNRYCEQKKIKLIRIPYYDYENIEPILDKKLLSNKDDIFLSSKAI